MIAVFSFQSGARAYAMALLPNPLAVLDGGGRVYLLAEVRDGGVKPPFRCVNPFDGTLLVDVRYFDTETAARARVAEDIAAGASNADGGRS